MNRTVRIAHLVFGLLFLGIATLWLLRTTDVLAADQLALSGPVVLIAAGVVGLVVSLASARQRRQPVEAAYDDPTTPTTEQELHHD